jgi:TatD DNase family protein
MDSCAGFIDTHAHLDDERLYGRLDEVLERAAAAGVSRVIAVGTSVESSAEAVRIARGQPLVRAAVGIHPHDSARAPADWRERLTRLVRESEGLVVAIGETGLDFHYMNSPREAQEELFRAHLELARELGLPVVVHSREAEERTMAILAEAASASGGSVRGVMHCFSGGAGMMRRAVELGLHVSFAGPVTFRNARALREVARQAPAERLLVETDSPYLAPEPHRGEANEPARVVEVVKTLAALRGVELDALAAETSANARRLFGLPEELESGPPAV